jgi:excisionase family DNA binding protein
VTELENQDVIVNKLGHQYLTKAQVCMMLALSPRAVEGWMRRGILPYFKIGRWVRFLEDDIHHHLQKYRIDRHNRFQPRRRSQKMEDAASNLLKSRQTLDQPGE